MKIILVRHGESVDDTINCYGGAADFALSETGKKEAIVLAETFKEVQVDKIYSSPLKRAKQTAEKIEAVKQCGITEISDLRERNSYGVISGCSKEDCKDIYGYLIDNIKGKLGDYYSDEVLLGAELHLEFDERIEAVINGIIQDAKANGYENIVVVTHGNVTRSIYQNILKFEKKIDLDHLAKTVMTYNNETFTLVFNEGVYEK